MTHESQYIYDRTDPHYRSALLEHAANEVLTRGSVKAAAKRARKLAAKARSVDARAYFEALAATVEG